MEARGEELEGQSLPNCGRARHARPRKERERERACWYEVECTNKIGTGAEGPVTEGDEGTGYLGGEEVVSEGIQQTDGWMDGWMDATYLIHYPMAMSLATQAPPN